MKKRWAVLFVLLLTASAWAADVYDVPRYMKGIQLQEIAAPPTPPSGRATLYVDTSNNLKILDDTGTTTTITSGAGDNTLDDAYDQGGAGAGGKIDADSGTVEIEVDDTSNNTALLLDMDDVTNNPNVLVITNAGSGADIVAPSFTLTAGAMAGASLTTTGTAAVGTNLTVTGNSTIGVGGDDTVSIVSTGLNVSTAGALTGVADITGTAGAPMTVTIASDGAADDLTLSVTGATDSSVILSSAGTGTDAISLQASAGGVDIDSPAAQDTNVAGGQVALVSKDNAASAISATTNVGTSETIVVTNTQGTAEGAITLTSTAGGVDVDAAAGKNIALDGGQVLIASKDNVASAIALTANVGTTETVVVTNTQGTAEGAITLTSTAGGLDVDAAAAKNVDIAGGQVLLSSKDNGASAIQLLTNVGAAETIVITNTQGTGTAAIDINGSAGGVDIDAAGPLGLNSSQVAATAVTLAASAGGVDITSAATYDIDLTATGGTVQVIASEAAANQFKVDAQGTIGGFAIVLETSDGGVQINADGVANGDVTVDAGDDLTLIAAGDLVLTVTGAVNAGGSPISNVRMVGETVAAANVITAAECGSIFYLNDATEFQSTLPALSTVSTGCVMEFVVGAAPSGASYTVITGNSLENQIYGTVVVNGASVTVSAGDTITFTDSAAVKGDSVRLTSDGTSWYVSGIGNAATAITLTQAD